MSAPPAYKKAWVDPWLASKSSYLKFLVFLRSCFINAVITLSLNIVQPVFTLLWEL